VRLGCRWKTSVTNLNAGLRRTDDPSKAQAILRRKAVMEILTTEVRCATHDPVVPRTQAPLLCSRV
jgi:hypothetical protein